MSLKKLSRFQYFDIELFIELKKLQIISVQEWLDYDTKNCLGTKVEVVIISDRTDYGTVDGETVSNLYEKLMVKIPAKLTNVPIGAEVKLINPEASVYGEFRNQLSITAENIEIVKK